MLGIIPLLVIAPIGFRFLFGGEFQESVIPFAVLCVAIPGAVISAILGAMYNLDGKLFKSAVVFNFISSGAGLFLSIILVPSNGIIGAAVGTAVAFFLGQTLILFDQSAKHGERLHRLFLVYAITVLIAVFQALPIMSFENRILIGLGALLTLIWASRYFVLVDNEVIKNLLPKSLASVGELLCFLLSTKKF